MGFVVKNIHCLLMLRTPLDTCKESFFVRTNSTVSDKIAHSAHTSLIFTLLHSERPKLYGVLAFMNAIGSNRQFTCTLTQIFISVEKAL